jgi:acyl-CoA synthetase (NDP forming)
MACKYQILGTRSAPLNSVKCEQQSQEIITALKKPDQAELFQAAAESVVDAGGGQLPSPDRLKRQQFTQELISALTRDRAT